MLSEELKSQIQQAYSQLLEAKGYSARLCQKQMIADIANTLGNISVNEAGERETGGHICVIEAGTGTGKTLAYMMAALPIARALNKRLVVSTATVALQEQIVLVDLPDIMRHSGLDFTFALAKGRRRYLCLSRLDSALQSDSPNQNLAFYDDEFFPDGVSDMELYREMLARLGRSEWDGDRDTWPEEIEHAAWIPISTDHVQCTGRKCSHYDNCYFYKAREHIHKVDCVVTNHDLVLSDLMMGGGAVLPAPEETIYIFDEGHHLPDKAVNHFSSFMQIRSSQAWLEQIPGTLERMVDEMGEVGGLPASQTRFEDTVSDLVASLEDALQRVDEQKGLSEGDEKSRRYRFERGMVTDDIRDMSHNLHSSCQRLQGLLQVLESGLEDALGYADAAEREDLERWVPLVAAMAARSSACVALWQDFMIADRETEAPKARWLNFLESDEVTFNASPVAVHETLQELLWSRCFGAVVTSATLAMGQDFTRFFQQTGISTENHSRALLSPFRFQQQATLRVPKMDVDPKTPDEHNEAVADILPEILDDAKGGLVLFSSWRQLNRVSELLNEEFMARVLSQGTFSKAEIVSRHKEQVDAGVHSVIFGLASFAEGIDLPGNYCDHVVVVKIPFAVPDDPVGATLSEWIEANGGNSFQEIMIPDAALRMVQACGRLLRTETDSGTITLLDRRIVTKRYGRQLLDALPPFRREIV